MCQGDAKSEGPEVAVKAKTPTLADLRNAIPKECFEHSLVQSLWLVLRDALVMASLFVLATSLLRTPGLSAEPLTVFDWAGWVVYSFVQGSAAIGWWVLAHECGHGGFSQYRLLNDTVGWVMHSILLVPYFSWQYSHGKHHAKTNHLLDGETHVPDTHDELEKVGLPLMHRLLGDDAFAAVQLVNHLVFGWPMYMFFNVTGGRRLNGKVLDKPLPGFLSHFSPASPLFPEQWRMRIALSTVGIALTLSGLAWAANTFGCAAVAVHYFGPYLWVNFWLVLYTWLQHTDPAVPHYGEDEWTWLKGALCTIDRPYTFFDWFHHHIGSTHVCHHVFSALPCYNAVKATKHLKAYLEPMGLYNYDATPWLLAAWRIAKTCHYIDGVEGTQYFKSFSDKPQGQKPKKQ